MVSYISVMEGDVIKIRSKHGVYMNLIFSEEELVAIAKLANAMIVADGKVAEREMDSWIMEMERFGVSKSDFHLWYWKSEGLSLTDALGVVSKLDDERKKYIGAFLGALMAVDGHVDGDELKLWQLTSMFCDLPTMSVMQALEYMAELSAKREE